MYYPSHQSYVDLSVLNPAPEDHYFSAHNSNKLHGWLFKNKSGAKNPDAVVVFFHGNAQNVSAHFRSLYWILEHKIDFFIFDYQGYGYSEGMPSPKNNVLDGIEAIKYVRSLYPKTKLVLFGQSMGSNVVSRVAVETQSEFPVDLIVLDSSFESFKKAGSDVLARKWILWPLQWVPYLVLTDSWAVAPVVERFPKVPVFFIHGKKDQVIAYELGEKFYNDIRGPKYFFMVEKARHIESLYLSEELRKKLLMAIQNPSLVGAGL